MPAQEILPVAASVTIDPIKDSNSFGIVIDIRQNPQSINCPGTGSLRRQGGVNPTGLHLVLTIIHVQRQQPPGVPGAARTS